MRAHISLIAALLLATSAAHARPAYETAPVYECGNASVTHTVEINSKDKESFHIFTVLPHNQPRTITIQSDTKTGRMTVNGKPCKGSVQAFEGPAVQTFEGLLPPPFGPINKGWVGSEHGGNLQEHVERWKALAASGKDVEIRGFCPSACTLVTAYVPKERLCFSQIAVLGFHLARDHFTGEPDIEASRWVFNSYPQDIRMWLQKKGGVEKMPLESLWLLFASELWEMGYRQCDWLGIMPGHELWPKK